MHLPVLSVVEAAPELPRPLKCLLLACADLTIEWRQCRFARQVGKGSPTKEVCVIGRYRRRPGVCDTGA